MNETVSIKRRGRKPVADRVRVMPFYPRESEYAIIRERAEACGVSFSRFVVEAALERARAMAAASDVAGD